jgi:Na+/melibiose symporter-like transporter
VCSAAFGGDASGAWSLVAALIGGTLAATAHTAKSTTRAAANTSPEPFSNIGLSLLGDVAVPTMLWLAWEHAAWFWPVLALVVVLSLVLIVLLFRFLRGLWKRFTGGPPLPMNGVAAG